MSGLMKTQLKQWEMEKKHKFLERQVVWWDAFFQRFPRIIGNMVNKSLRVCLDWGEDLMEWICSDLRGKCEERDVVWIKVC